MQPSEVVSDIVNDAIHEVAQPPKKPGRGKTVTFQRNNTVAPEKLGDLIETNPVPIFDPHASSTPEERADLAARSASPAKFLERRVNQTVKEWLSQLGDKPVIKIQVHRSKPEKHNGKAVSGYIKSYDYLITEEEIKELHGGGTYQLRVTAPNMAGKLVYAGQTIIEIAGDPRDENGEGAIAVAPGPVASVNPMDNPFFGKVWDSMEGKATRAEEALEKMRVRAGSGGAEMITQFQLLMKPLEMQLHAALEDGKALRMELVEARKTPPTNPMLDRLFEKSITDGDTRVNAIKMQYESEIRVIKENHAADISRLNDRMDRERDRMTQLHDREVKTLTDSFNRELGNLRTVQESSAIATKASSEVNTTLLQRENERLSRELTELRTDFRALQATKNQTLVEKAKEIRELKESLSDGEDAPETSTIGKIFETVAGSKDLLDMVKSWGPSAGAPADPQVQAQQVQQQPQQQMVPQQKVRFVRNKATGVAYQINPDGSKVPLRQRAEDGSEHAVVAMDPEQVNAAITLLEMACRNKVKPENFATTARSHVSEPIMAAIRRDGVDGFLAKVAQLEQGSPLNSQEGRNWIRKVGKALLAGG